MDNTLDNYKAPFTAKEFGKWVDSEWDTEMLEMVQSMISNRIDEINSMISVASKVEIKGFK